MSLVKYLLQIADDNMVLAQRLGELVSWMPELEEDIAVANIALDHLGQATALYGYAAELGGEGKTADDLAMGRDERDYMNCVLVEQPNGDFGQIMARQFFVDAYQVPLYRALARHSDHTLAGIAQKAEKEARYHLQYSSKWVIRLGDGTGESHLRMQDAISAMWPFTGDLFTAETEGVDLTAIRTEFDTTVGQVMAEATVSLPEDPYQRLGGRTGVHTEHLGHMLAEMQSLYRTHAGAQW